MTKPMPLSNADSQAEFDQIQAGFLTALDDIDKDLEKLARPDALSSLQSELAHRHIAAANYDQNLIEEQQNRLDCAVELLTRLNNSASEIGYNQRESTTNPQEAEQKILSILSEINEKSLDNKFKNTFSNESYRVWKKASREIEAYPRRIQENEQQIFKINNLLQPDAKKRLQDRRKEIQSQSAKITKQMLKQTEQAATRAKSQPEQKSRLSASENGFVYDLITGKNKEFELAGVTLLAMGKPNDIIDGVFSDLQKALETEATPQAKASYLANAQNLLQRLIAFDSQNTHIPNFSNSTTDSIQRCKDIMSSVLDENKTSQFFSTLVKQQADNIKAKENLDAQIHATLHPSATQYDVATIITQNVTKKNKSKTEINNFAKIMASDLKKTQAALATSIPMTDLTGNRWIDHNSHAAINTDFFNRLCSSVQADILNAKTVPNQIKMVKFYLKVLKNCRNEGDYNSYLAILAAIKSTTVNRLSYINQDPGIARAIEFASAITNRGSNSKAFREEIRNNTAPQVIPYTGLMYTDLTFTQDGNPNKVNDNLNPSKMGVLFKILAPYQQLTSELKQQSLSPPESNIYNYIMTSPALTDDQKYDQSEQLYRKITFKTEPTLADLFKAVTTSSSRFKLGTAFEFRFPRIPDITLEHEQKRLNHEHKPRKSYLFMLDVITQSLKNDPSLENRFFANEMLKQIQKNISDTPRLQITLKSALKEAQTLINLNPALVNDLNQLASLSQKYSNMVQHPDIFSDTQKADSLMHARDFLNALSGKYPELDARDSTAIHQLVIDARARLEQIEQLDSQAIQHQVDSQRQEDLHINSGTTSNNRIAQLVMVRNELEKLEGTIRKAASSADPAVSAVAKAKMASLGITAHAGKPPETKWVRTTDHRSKPSPTADEANPAANEASPAADEASPTADEASPAADEPSHISEPQTPVPIPPEPIAAPLPSNFKAASPSTSRPTILGAAPAQHRANVIEHLFTALNPTPIPINEQSIVQTKSSINDLKTYLSPEKQALHRIATIVENVDSAKQLTGLEINFEPSATGVPLKAYANNVRTSDSIQLSISKRLAGNDFAVIAERIATLSVATAKNNAEFDISISPNEQKRAILKSAFEKAIENAMNKTPPQFTNDTKPTLKTSSEPPRTPNISHRSSP